MRVDDETPAATIERLEKQLVVALRHKMRYREIVREAAYGCVECALCDEAWIEGNKAMVIRECAYCENTFCADCLAPCALCQDVVCAKCGPCPCKHDAEVDAAGES